MVKKAKTEWHGRLPDGRETQDQDEYVASWRGLAKPICTALGGVLSGFDPHLTIRVGSVSYEIDIVIAMKFNEMARELEELRVVNADTIIYASCPKCGTEYETEPGRSGIRLCPNKKCEGPVDANPGKVAAPKRRKA